MEFLYWTLAKTTLLTSVNIKMSNTAIEPPTAMGMARKYKKELIEKLRQYGLVSFRDYFLSAYWDELPNEELTADKIDAAVNYLDAG